MRRIISLVLVAAMLVCGIVIPATTASATTILEDNVAAEAHYFDGNVVYLENSGTKGDSYEDPEDVKNGNESHTLTIDGVIEDGEWGDVTVHVDSAYAASNLSATGAWLEAQKNDAIYTHPSAENTYFYGQAKSKNTREFSYDLYFMWDEDFLYVAAHVNDPYNHQNNQTGEGCWNGDALQFMVDPQGPNSAAVADGTTYAYRAEHGIKHEKRDDGSDYVLYDNSPWNGAVVGGGGVLYTPVSNFIIAYSSSGGGYTEAWDAALRYNPYEEEFNNTDENGEIFVDHRTKWKTAGIAEGYQDDFWAEQDVGAYATARPTNVGSVKNPKYETEYEIAIPWEMITLANNDGTFQDKYVAEAGGELGITVACLNASLPGTGDYDSWLSWGSGVCGSQTMYDYQTAGGSNLLTLSGTSYKAYSACEHTFAAATCEAPETCTKCGYERGFEAGHSYVCTNEVLPTASSDGSVVATCSVCHKVTNLTLEATDSYKYFGFSTSDDRIPDKMSSGWQVNWYDQADDSADGRQGNMLYYKDASGNLKAKTAYDTSTFGYAVADCATRGDGLFLVDGSPVEFKQPIDTKTLQQLPEVDYSTQTGTYFDTDLSTGRYTYKMDIMPTSYTQSSRDRYAKGLYNWFGKKAADYMAGLFVFGAEEGTPTYLFAIANTDICNPLYQAEDLEKFEANCERYVEVPYEKVKTNEWHQWVFIYDDDAQYASLYWDGEQVISAYNPQFKHLGTPYVLFRRMNIPFYAKNVDFGTISYSNNYISSGSKYTVTIINGDKQTTAQYAAGETVELSTETFRRNEKNQGCRFIGWTGDITDSKAVTSFTMPSKDVTINAEYCIVGDLNSDGKVNANDAVQIKKMIVGKAEKIAAADIDNNSKVNANDAAFLKKMVVGKYSVTE